LFGKSHCSGVKKRGKEKRDVRRKKKEGGEREKRGNEKGKSTEGYRRKERHRKGD